jgi:hypothetical protein
VARSTIEDNLKRAALNGLPGRGLKVRGMAARAGQSSASPCSSLDYHIEVHDFLYSVPPALICAEVEVCVTARTVVVFHRGQRVAVHQRRCMGRKHGTDPDHMPSSTGVAPNGRRIGSAAGPARSGQTPRA